MPFVKIWIHAVWATKSRKLLLTKEIRSKIFEHIKENAKKKEIFIDCVNGHIEHVHCLISLGTEQNIAKVIQLIKGESSYWINKENLLKNKFEWQDEYFAVSISESGIGSVREYIHNQEEHHKKKTFQQEYDEFIEKYGWKVLG